MFIFMTLLADLKDLEHNLDRVPAHWAGLHIFYAPLFLYKKSNLSYRIASQQKAYSKDLKCKTHIFCVCIRTRVAAEFKIEIYFNLKKERFYVERGVEVLGAIFLREGGLVQTHHLT